MNMVLDSGISGKDNEEKFKIDPIDKGEITLLLSKMQKTIRNYFLSMVVLTFYLIIITMYRKHHIILYIPSTSSNIQMFTDKRFQNIVSVLHLSLSYDPKLGRNIRTISVRLVFRTGRSTFSLPEETT